MAAVVFVSIICHEALICIYNVLFFSLLPCSLCPQPAPWLSMFPSLMACTEPSFLKAYSSVTLPLLVCNHCTLTFTPGYGTISKAEFPGFPT